MTSEQLEKLKQRVIDLFAGVRDGWCGEMGKIWERVFSRYDWDVVYEAIDRHRIESKYQICQPVDIENQCRKILAEKMRNAPRPNRGETQIQFFRKELNQYDGDDESIIYAHFTRCEEFVANANSDYGKKWVKGLMRSHMTTAFIEIGYAESEARAKATEFFGPVEKLPVFDVGSEWRTGKGEL